MATQADDPLTADELQAVTGKAQPKSQAAALARMGLPFRFTGRAVVLERQVARAHELLPKPATGGGVRLDKAR